MLTAKQTEIFARDGALVVRDVIDAECIAQVRTAFAKRVDDLIARAVQSGAMSAPDANADFDRRLTALLCAAPEYYQHLDISLPMIADLAGETAAWRRLFGEDWRRQAGFFAPDAVFNLIMHPKAVAIARQVLGGDAVLSPVQHVRIKPPQHLLPPAAQRDANMARTLWHQDEAVVTEDAAGVPILTMWIAISDATPENGCMYAVRGSHLRAADNARDFGLTRHCPGKELAGEIYIPEELIDRQNLVPLAARSGDVVLLHRRTIHGAGANTSSSLRWSFDLRFQPPDTPSGRDCFPSFALSGAEAAANGEEYRAKWRTARDNILNGKTKAAFNTRWDKYAGVCA